MRFFVFFLLVSNQIFGQNPSRQILSEQAIPDGYKVKVTDGEYIFRAYSNKVVETTFIPNGKQEDSISHTVDFEPLQHPFTIGKTSNGITFFTQKGIEIRIDYHPFKVSYWYQGKYITSEKNGYEPISTGESLQFNLEKDEVLYGGGARALGMNRRGNRLQLYNRAHYGYEEKAELMNYCMPLVLSNKLYAIHFDNAPIGYLDLDSKKNNTLTYETISGRMVYQVIVGDDWKDLVKEYTFLTGRQPLPPRWAFGNFASRFGYHSEAEARKVVTQFRKDSIPLDAIIFDLYWFGKTIQGTLGNLSFYRDSFPNPEKMIQDFAQNKVKTILITEPFILTTSSKWKEAEEKKLLGTDSLGNPFKYDFYFGNTGLLDIYQPHVLSWFWDVYKNLANKGVKGFWGDLGEPEVHPAKLYHGDKMADEVHNIYGHDWARLLAEGYARDFPDERHFTLMRSGSTGSQKYGIIPWSGDVNRTWGGLRPQPEISLQMGLQGIGYMHSDLGGFAGANDDPELYVRWLQYGVFQPIFRPHAQEEVASEVIFKDDKTKQLAKEAIELRYRMLPYNYSLAYENHVNGTPLMRPVFMENKEATWSEVSADCYMWGSAFYVLPVFSKADGKMNVRMMSLQDNAVWYDFFSGEKLVYEKEKFGKKVEDLLINVTPEHIPVYVKAGAFVPLSETIQSTEEYKPSNVTVHYYSDASVKNGSGIWYEDDGKTTYTYEKGAFGIIHFSSTETNKNVVIDLRKEIGTTGIDNFSGFKMLIHIDSTRKIKVNGKKVKNLSTKKGEVLVNVPSFSKDLKIEILK